MNLYLCFLIAVLVSVGVYCLLQPNIMRIIIGVVILSNAAHMVIFVAGGLTERIVPIIGAGNDVLPANAADPVPQALILTAIVISFAITAYLMLLCREYYSQTGNADLPAGEAQ